MIERIVIDGYRCFAHLDFVPNVGVNIIVGDNESGKSTLLEAIALALTGRVNGRWAQEELNPFWFNQGKVNEFFTKFGGDEQVAPPEISIELYLSDASDELHKLRGVHNSLEEDRAGIRLRITPADDYAEEFAAYLADDPPAVMPVEFYAVDWRDFSDMAHFRRPKALATSFIDSRTIRATSGVDHHTKEMLSEHLAADERASISVAHRKSRQQITDGALGPINERIAEASAGLHDRPIGLQLDQSARSSWEAGVVPQVEDIPFAMSGQGQQAAIKVALAMSRTVGAATFVLIEEPENHLSYTSLSKLVARIETIAADDQQLFISTHSSFVANRLGLDRLVLLHSGHAAALTALDTETVEYFRKLPGYDTLRLVLARSVVLVEGPSDEIVFSRAYKDATNRWPHEDGIDVISMGGLTFKRALAVCASIDRQAVALQDNDDNEPDAVREPVLPFLKDGSRHLLVSDPANGATLEPQILAANEEAALRALFGVTPAADLNKWMPNNKTEAALRILDSSESIQYPAHISEAVELLR